MSYVAYCREFSTRNRISAVHNTDNFIPIYTIFTALADMRLYIIGLSDVASV